MPGLPDWLWDVQERFLLWVWRLKDVGPIEGGALRIRAVTYRGDGFGLSDGTSVTPGQRIGEVHLRNDTLASLHDQAEGPRQVGWLFRDLMVRGLRDLAELVRDGEPYRHLPAFYGTSMLHYGADKLGFEVRPVRPGVRLSLLRAYQRVLTARYHPLGSDRMSRGTRVRDPAEVWISRRTLLARYGSGSENLGEAGEAEAGVAKPGNDVG